MTLTRKSVKNVWCRKRATCRCPGKILVTYIKLPYVLSKFKVVVRYLCLYYLFFHFTGITSRSFCLEVVQTGLVESEDWSNLYFPCFPLLQLVFLVRIVLRDQKFQSTNCDNQTCSLESCRKSPGNRLLQCRSATKLKTYQSVIERPGAVKCELGKWGLRHQWSDLATSSFCWENWGLRAVSSKLNVWLKGVNYDGFKKLSLRLNDSLTDWLMDWLTDWLMDWLTKRLSYWLVG